MRKNYIIVPLILLSFSLNFALYGQNSGGITGIATPVGIMAEVQGDTLLLLPSSISTGEDDIHFTKITDNFDGFPAMEDKSITSLVLEFKVSVKVYPNPVKDNMFIETGNINVGEIKLFNLNGQIQNRQVSIHYGVDKIQISTSQLQSGIYLLRLETETGTIIKKIIVQ